MATTGVRRAGEKAAGNPALRGAARVGLVGRGLLYAVVGILALRVALGRGSGEHADAPGALETLADSTLGRVALLGTALGLAGIAGWQVVCALRGRDLGLGRRAGRVLSALGHAAVAVVAAAFAAGGGSASAGGRPERDVTARAMSWPLGRWLVGAVGAALLVAGAVELGRAARRRFRAPADAVPDRASPFVTALGAAGHAGRALAVALVGGFVVRAALRHDPSQAAGLDDALRQVAGTPAGRVLTGAVGAGLLAYGVFEAVEARYRRSPDP